MDAEWLADCHRTIEHISYPGGESRPRDPPAEHTDPDQWQTHSSFFAGQPGPSLEGRQLWDAEKFPDGAPPGGLLGLPQPYSDPFRRMLDCPALAFRLNWMMGAGWAVPHGSLGIRSTRRGEAGLHLHAGGTPASPSNLLTWFDGRTHCECAHSNSLSPRCRLTQTIAAIRHQRGVPAARCQLRRAARWRLRKYSAPSPLFGCRSPLP